MGDIRHYADSLKESSYVLKEILDPFDEDSFKDWKTASCVIEIGENLDRLRRLRAIATFIPLFLASRIAFRKFPEIFLEITKLCEVYAFRVYKIANRRADTGKSVIYSVANNFYQSRLKFPHQTDVQIRKNIGDDLDRILSYIQSHCDDEAFRRFLTRDDIYSSYYRSWLESYEVKYLLYEYEKTLRKSKKHKEPTPSWKDVEERLTIEHILSETPKEYERWTDEKKKIHGDYVHRLGNLTLATWEWNSSLGNSNFDVKRLKYEESTFLVQRDLTKYGQWWQDEVETRTPRIN